MASASSLISSVTTRSHAHTAETDSHVSAGGGPEHIVRASALQRGRIVTLANGDRYLLSVKRRTDAGLEDISEQLSEEAFDRVGALSATLLTGTPSESCTLSDLGVVSPTSAYQHRGRNISLTAVPPFYGRTVAQILAPEGPDVAAQRVWNALKDTFNHHGALRPVYTGAVQRMAGDIVLGPDLMNEGPAVQGMSGPVVLGADGLDSTSDADSSSHAPPAASLADSRAVPLGISPTEQELLRERVNEWRRVVPRGHIDPDPSESSASSQPIRQPSRLERWHRGRDGYQALSTSDPDELRTPSRRPQPSLPSSLFPGHLNRYELSTWARWINKERLDRELTIRAYTSRYSVLRGEEAAEALLRAGDQYYTRTKRQRPDPEATAYQEFQIDYIGRHLRAAQGFLD